MSDSCNCYSHINFSLNISNKQILSLLSQIDFDFCKSFNIGPYFLNTIPSLFTDEYTNKSLSLLTKLIRHCNLHLTTNTKINPQTFFTSTSLYQLISFNDINNAILYCGTMNFRIPLYLLKLNSIPIPSQYINTLNSPLSLPNDSSYTIKHQIELDIPRTSFQYPVLKQQLFSNNFKQLLYEIALRDNTLSYVQGMNFIAAFILMFTGNQLECSVFIFLKILYYKSVYFNREFRYCYLNDFVLMREYLILFKDVLYRYEPKIYDILISNEIDGLYWLSKWIQTIFVLNFKFEFTMKLWDIILVYGLDSMIPIAVSIIKYYEKDIMNVCNLEGFMEVLNKIYNAEENNKEKKLFNFIVNNVINNVYSL